VIQITPAQMTALETAGVFEPEDWDGLEVVRAAISGQEIRPSEDVARALHELANGADEIGHERGRDDGAMYRADSRSITALACKVRRGVI
jgi:hypothetical protein